MTLDKAYIVAFWLEALFYGLNSVLVWACVFVLIFKRRIENINKFFVTIVIIQYLVSTTDVSFGLARLITSFINRRDQSNGPVMYLSDESDPLNVAQVLFISLNSVLYESVMVWRCYCVWGRSWKMAVLPAALVIAILFCAARQVISSIKLRHEQIESGHKVILRNSISYGLSLSANIISTSLIAFRVRSLLRTSSLGAAPCKFAILLIESGMLYSAFLSIGLALYFSKTTSFYIFYQQFGQLASIMPNMMLLLVGLKLTSNDLHLNLPKSNSSTLSSINDPCRMTTIGRPIAITITNTVQYNSDYGFKV